MTPGARCSLDPPLDPERRRGPVAAAPRAAAARSTTRRTCVQRLLDWLARLLDRGLDAAAELPPLTTFAAMLVGLLLVGGSGWLVTRARRPRGRRASARPVLADERSPPPSCGPAPRRRSPRGGTTTRWSTASGRWRVRQVERGRIDDAPGATAHEVAVALAEAYPGAGRRRATGCAGLFDPVLYGDRPATARPGASTCSPSTTSWRRADDAPRPRPPAPAPSRDARLLAPAPRHAGRRRPARRRGRGRRCWSAAGRRPATPLDPDNPGPDGAQAVARVLEDQGVDVAASSAAADALERRRARRRHHRGGHLDRPPRPEHRRRGCSTARAGRRPGARRARARASSRRSGSSARPSDRGARRRPRGAGCDDPLFDGPRRSSVDHRRPSTTPRAGCFAGEHGAPGGRPARRRHPARRRPRLLDQRPGAARPTTPPWRCGCSASTTGWSGTSRRSTTSPATTASSLRDPAAATGSCPALWLVGVGRGRAAALARPPARPAGHRAAAGRRSRRSRPPAAGAGSTARPATARTPPRALRAAARAALADRLRLPARGTPTAALVRDVARAHRPPEPRGRHALLGSDAPRPGHRPRPDHAWPPTWPRSTERYAAHDRARTRPARRPTGAARGAASGWPPSAPRWPRPSSARTPPCPACSSRCCAAATC